MSNTRMLSGMALSLACGWAVTANAAASGFYRATYDFEPAPGALVDGSGNANTLVLGPGAVIDNTKSHTGTQSLKLNGAAGCIATAVDNPTLATPESFTAEAWFFPTITTPGVSYVIISKPGSWDLRYGNGGAGTPDQIATIITPQYSLPFGFSASSGVSVVQNAWNHAALSYDGVRIELVLNGQVVALGYWGGGRIATSNAPLTLGADPALTNAQYKGNIDEVRLAWGPPLIRDCPVSTSFDILSGLCCPPGAAGSNGKCCPTGSTNVGGLCCPAGMTNSGAGFCIDRVPANEPAYGVGLQLCAVRRTMLCNLSQLFTASQLGAIAPPPAYRVSDPFYFPAVNGSELGGVNGAVPNPLALPGGSPIQAPGPLQGVAPFFCCY
jgi:Concanavalin A-like lectin/glucanases superfamily